MITHPQLFDILRKCAFFVVVYAQKHSTYIVVLLVAIIGVIKQ